MFTAQHIPYAHTGILTKLVTDYLNMNEKIKPFYSHTADLKGIKAAIESRKKYPTNRRLLHDQLLQQYAGVVNTEKVTENIQLLLSEDTFTICTAHQPNIFTGRLYFIYKIIHVIKTADYLKQQLPQYNFVPVYYMGSEDADLQELGEIEINGDKLNWKTNQSGAVGRMIIDEAFITLMERIGNELSSQPNGTGLIGILKKAYQKGRTIDAATFELVHELFADYGLLIILPDNKQVKSLMISVFTKELTESFSNKILEKTITSFPAEYTIQAKGRDINLFYLKDNARERIEKTDNGYRINNTSISFSEQGMLQELNDYPERFSPNVILRPLLQEMLLPNVMFVGGGGELAYWLELKKIFESADVPCPVLVLRNSFLIIEKKNSELLDSLSLGVPDIFSSLNDLQKKIISRKNTQADDIGSEKALIEKAYEGIKTVAANADPTLEKHTLALRSGAIKKLEQLEKKMFRARKKTFEAEMRKIEKLKNRLFPENSLQERVENFLPYYAKYGAQFIEEIFDASGVFEQQFCVIIED